MHDPAGRDAIILKQTLTVAKNLEAATEVICSRTPSQLQYLRQIYHTKYGIYLDHDIERNASGDHKKVNLLSPSRSLPCKLSQSGVVFNVL
jgi:annexin A7/11